MPELPEVETVRRGIAPHVEGARIEAVALARDGLRFPFPAGFAQGLEGRTILRAGRRAKYLLLALSDGHTWLIHLGMTGVLSISGRALDEPSRRFAPAPGTHEHVRVRLSHPEQGPLDLLYADPRRFGFMDLIADEAASPRLAGLGPEPLGNGFSAQGLAARFAGRRTPVKAALLDQGVVAGLGNIYVCEALWRAGIAPWAPVGSLVSDGVPDPRLEALVPAIRAVLGEAIAAGGSTLRDFRDAEGRGGYFQHSFSVYGRAGEPCLAPNCTGTIGRVVQSGRSSFFCPSCQGVPSPG